MSKDPKQVTMPWLIPYLAVMDAGKSAAFYRDVFGFELLSESKDEQGNTNHAEMGYHDCVVMMGSEGCYGSEVRCPTTSKTQSPVTLYVYVDDVDKFYQRAVEMGAKSAKEPEDTFWGDRMCQVTDPDGHSWCFATKIKDQPH